MANCIDCRTEFSTDKSIVPYEGLSNILCSRCFSRMALQFEKEETT